MRWKGDVARGSIRVGSDAATIQEAEVGSYLGVGKERSRHLARRGQVRGRVADVFAFAADKSQTRRRVLCIEGAISR